MGRPRPRTDRAVTLTDATLAAHDTLRDELTRWVHTARHAGLDDESIDALIATTLRDTGPAGSTSRDGAVHDAVHPSRMTGSADYGSRM